MAAPSHGVAPLQIVGVCGQTVSVVVGGVTVSFSCLPPEKPSGGDDPGGGILDPDDLSGGHTALLRMDPDDLEQIRSIELQPGADPVVVRVGDGDVSLQDVAAALDEAHGSGRPLRLDVRPN